MMYPGMRLIQLGLRSLGTDPGAIDGWWGTNTASAVADALSRPGNPTSTPWGYEVLQRGLDDLGWYEGPIDGVWNDAMRVALAALLKAGGSPRSAAIVGSTVVTKLTSGTIPLAHYNKIMQSGKYLVDTLYLHTTATPTTWWRGKTNQQMFDEVKAWHTLPPSQGGNGWSDIGYHGLIFPDGGRIYGRALTTMGAGVSGHNAGSVHFSMVPIKTITKMGLMEDFYTPASIQAMKDEIERIALLTQLKWLKGHNEDAAKLCPGFIVNDGDWTARPVQ